MGLPKPKPSDSPNAKRKREIRKRDKAFQNAGPGPCEACAQYAEERTRHHIKKRRHMDTRWDMKNQLALCWMCHAIAEDDGNQALYDIYPRAEDILRLRSQNDMTRFKEKYGLEL